MNNTISKVYSDYNQLLTDIKTDNIKDSNLYEKVINIEQSSIDLLNRVANKDHNENIYSNIFVNKKLIDIVGICAAVWKAMIDDILLYKRTDLFNVFFEGERKIYSGILLIIIALLLFFVHISC